MRYQKVKSDEFIQNGRSTVRVGHVLTMVSPLTKGRTVKVFEVLESTRSNPANPIPRGAMLALSFPDEKVWDDAYEWQHGEEAMVPLTITDPKVDMQSAQRARRN